MELIFLLGLTSTAAIGWAVSGDTADSDEHAPTDAGEAEAENAGPARVLRDWHNSEGGTVRLDVGAPIQADQPVEQFDIKVVGQEDDDRIWIRFNDYWDGKYDGFNTNFDPEASRPLGEQAFDVEAGEGDDHVRIIFDTVGLGPLDLVDGRIDAGDGDDLVETNAADVIHAGDGHDMIRVQGNVAVFGGAGDDRIIAGMADEMAHVTSHGSGEAEHIIAHGGSGEDIFAIGRNHYWNGTLEVADFNPDDDQLIIQNGFGEDFGYAPDQWGSEVIASDHRVEDGDTYMDLTIHHFSIVPGHELDAEREVSIILRDAEVDEAVLQDVVHLPTR